jgi:hypothetical protein
LGSAKALWPLLPVGNILDALSNINRLLRPHGRIAAADGIVMRQD